MNEYEVANGHKRPDQYRSGSFRAGPFPDYRESEQLVGVSIPQPPRGASGAQSVGIEEKLHRWAQKGFATFGGLAFIGGLITVVIRSWGG